MHVFQVGAGSGGMVLLDLLARDPRIQRITLVEPDTYQAHNAARHYFPAAAAGQRKVDLARDWLAAFRPDVQLTTHAVDVMDPACQELLAAAVANADLGICAVDSEPAKFHIDALMRQAGKPWTMGEVLSGGIGGWVHVFEPGEACYGCVASHLQRSIVTDRSPPPDYANPAGPAETRIPASKAAIHIIASMHALISLQRLEGKRPGFTSLLWTLAVVEEVFAEAFRPYRFRIARSPECLICGLSPQSLPAGEALDVALDQALARLGHE